MRSEKRDDLECQCGDRKSHIEQQIQVIHRQFDEEMELIRAARGRLDNIYLQLKKLSAARRKLEAAEVRRAAAEARELRGNERPKLRLVSASN